MADALLTRRRIIRAGLKNGHELALDPINPAVRRRIIDLRIFQRRAKPTANDRYVAMDTVVRGAALAGAEVSAVLVDTLHFRYQRAIHAIPGLSALSHYLMHCPAGVGSPQSAEGGDRMTDAPSSALAIDEAEINAKAHSLPLTRTVDDQLRP